MKHTMIRLRDPSADAVVELSLEVEGAREDLSLSRRESRRELRWAIGVSCLAGLCFAIEAWATWRGEPVFGWLVFVLFTGFSVYFWRRRRRAAEVVSTREEALALLEARRARVPGSDDPAQVPPLDGGG